MKNKFGTVEYNGKTLWLTQQAYITNNPYNLQAVMYEALAVDEGDNEYMVRWLPRQDWLAEDEESACNWDKPDTVVEY